MTFQKLAKRIKKDLGLDVHSFSRCYSSRQQLEGFALSWVAITSGKRIGSNVNATNILKKKENLEIIDQQIDFIEIM